METQDVFSETLPVALYIHIPFCERKCPYCDFNSYAGLSRLYGAFTEALVREIRFWGERLARPPLRSVFLGGGTPTVLPPAFLEAILTAVYDAFHLPSRVEITVEANPGTVDRQVFRTLRSLGVNRLSLGAQSFWDDELQFLGRVHTVSDVLRAVEEARRAGFDNLNIDLIYGLPRQPMARWKHTLHQILALEPEHISCYALSVEPGTPLARQVAQGRIPATDDDLQGAMYQTAQEILARGGFVHYEISNWARPRHQSVHNTVYWRHEPYLGLGPGAHAFDGRTRWWIVRGPGEYVRRIGRGDSPVEGWEALSEEMLAAEMMMLGLRLLVEGVSRSRFRNRFGQDPVEKYHVPLQRFSDFGFLLVEEDRIRLTPRAYAVANQIFLAFLPEPEG